MKPLLALLALASLTLGAGACGGKGGATGSASKAPSNAARTSGGPASVAVRAAPPAGGLRGDEDDDDEHEANVPLDSDIDRDNDVKDSQGKGYYDGDDAPIRYFGHAASATDRRAITELVRRYYAAAAADDGATACALTYSIVAEAVPEAYGQAPGPAFLRGLKTCPAILTLLFKRLHSSLAQPIEVIAVRVERRRADALLGSSTKPASVIELRKERGAWKIDRVLAGPLS